MTSITSLRLQGFLSVALSSTSSTGKKSEIPTDVSSLRSAFLSGANDLAQSYQGLNQLASILTSGEDSLEKLGKIVDKVISVAEKASRVGSYRKAATQEFKKLARDYDKVVDSSKVGEESLTSLDGVQTVFKAFGLDEEVASSVASVFAPFLTKGTDDSLADTSQRGRRPIRATEDANEILPAGTFGSASVAVSGFNSAGGIRSLPKGDFNGDGKMDMAILADASAGGVSHLFIAHGNGDGTFSLGTSVVGYAPSTGSPFVDAGNFDKDFRTDLVLMYSDPNPDNILIVEETSQTTITVLANEPTGVGGTGINYLRFETADLNNDGDDDFVSIDSGGNLYGVASQGASGADTYFLFNANANPGIPPVLADFDGDGFTDFMVQNSTVTAMTYYKNPSGYVPSTTGTSTALVDGGAGNVIIAIAGDFNGDGKQDLATNNRTTDINRVYYGNGNGSFQSAITLSGPAFAAGTTWSTRSYNNDDYADIVWRNPLTNTGGIMRGNGDGTFASVVSFGLVAGSTTILGTTTFDYNNDGAEDLITAYNDKVFIRLQDTVTQVTSGSGKTAKELDSLFNSGRTLNSLSEAKLVLTDAKELKKQIQTNLKAYKGAKSYLQNTMELVRTTTLGLSGLSNTLTKAADAEQLAAMLNAAISSMPAKSREALDTLIPLIGNARLRATA